MLDELIAQGLIWVEKLPTGSSEYVGRAADGAEVSFGLVGEEKAVERYLAARPTPDLW